MAEIETKTSKKKTGKKYLIKKRLPVDLTPMVDLGFLLITFFILTTSLTTPAVANLIMPKDYTKENNEVCESCALTLLPQGNDELYYYEGIAQPNTVIHKTSYAPKDGLRDLIQAKQQKLKSLKGSKDETVIIIKPGKQSSYKNMIDILDEMKINDIAHYFISGRDVLDKKLTGND